MRCFGLIGYPLSHSFSRKYFKEKFINENLEAHFYQNFPLQEIHEFENILVQNPDLLGLNVTIPYKLDIIPFLDELDETAQAVGAVNTIKIKRLTTGENLAGLKNNFFLKGYNTDVYGFEMSIRPLLQPNHFKALILGTGGASKAVEYVLKKLGISYLIVSRNPKGDGQVGYKDLNATAVTGFPFIINTSPVGTSPNVDACPDIPYEHLTAANFLYDLVYNPDETLFLKKGKEKGAITQNGLSMLKLQAEKAWEIWNS
jgi:shikimate dehydrogenase